MDSHFQRRSRKLFFFKSKTKCNSFSNTGKQSRQATVILDAPPLSLATDALKLLNWTLLGISILGINIVVFLFLNVLMDLLISTLN